MAGDPAQEEDTPRVKGGEGERSRRGCCVWLTPFVLLIVLAITLTGIVVCYFELRQREEAREAAQARLADVMLFDAVKEVEQTMRSSIIAGKALATGFDFDNMTQWLTLDQFQSMGDSFRESIPEIQSFLWAPLVTQARRAEYENISSAMWHATFPDDPQTFYPIVYDIFKEAKVLPYDTNFSYPIMMRNPPPPKYKKNMRNADVYTMDAARTALLEDAVRSKECTASHRLWLVQSSTFGILNICPTVATDAGVMRTIVMLEEVFLNALSNRMLVARNSGFQIYLHDITPGAAFEYLHGIEFRDGAAGVDDVKRLNNVTSANDDFTLAQVRAQVAAQEPESVVVSEVLFFLGREWQMTMVVLPELLVVADASVGDPTALVVSTAFCFVLLIALVLYDARRGYYMESAKRKEVMSGMQQAVNYVVHELRNPVHAIRYFTDEVAETVRDYHDPHCTEMIGLLRANTNSLYYLVNGFLDVAKEGQTGIVLSQSPVDLAELIRNSFAVYSTMNASSECISYHLSIEPEVRDHLFYFDPVRVEQVMANGLSNAAKYTRAGSITVTASVEPCGSASSVHVEPIPPSPGMQSYSSLETESRGGGMHGSDGGSGSSSSNTRGTSLATDASKVIVIRIMDTGVGVGGIDTESIFADFKQSANNASQVIQRASTGLGLPIARKLARLMKGEVRLVPNAQADCGACYEFSLPYVVVTNADGSNALSVYSGDSGSKAGAGLYEGASPKQAVDEKLDWGDVLGDILPEGDGIGVEKATTATSAASKSKTAAAAAARVAKKKKQAPLHGLKVLAAEDEPATHIILKRMLKKGGCEAAKMFFEGSELARQYVENPSSFNKYDVILLDMNMTYDSGEVTFTKLIDAGCRKPCIMVTGACTTEDVEHYTSIGFAGVVGKPYSAAQLYEAIHAALKQSRAPLRGDQVVVKI